MMLWPYLLTMSLRLASAHLTRAWSDAAPYERMWSRLPQPLHLLGRPHPPRLPRWGLPRPPCDPRPAATNSEMGERGPLGAMASAPGSLTPCFGQSGECWPLLRPRTRGSKCRRR
jgi:hypothetical protein